LLKRIFLCIAVLASTACPAPTARDLTVTVELGPEGVEVRGSFRDLRLHHVDELLAFRQVDRVVRPQWLGLSELGTVRRYELIDTGDRLDLEVAGTVERAWWDRCLTLSPGQPKGKCEGFFPFARRPDGLEMRVTDWVNVYEFPSGFERLVPAGAKGLTYRLVSRRGRNDGPSALMSWRAYQADAEGSRRVSKWMEEVDRAFASWSEKDSPNVVENPPAPLSPRLETLASTFVYRKRLALIREALIDSNIEVPAPPEAELMGRLGRRTRLLAQALPRKQARRLERAYRGALAEPTSASANFRTACAGAKSEELNAVCAMLGAR
jgi:hypothetical protein